MSSTAKAKTAKLSKLVDLHLGSMAYFIFSPYSLELLQFHTGKSTDSNGYAHRQYSMGENREEDIFEAQLRDTARGTVSISYASRFSYHWPIFNSQLEAQQYSAALSLIDNLLTELKRLDDKMILTEVHLLESRVYRGIGNLSKAKVGLFQNMSASF